MLSAHFKAETLGDQCSFRELWVGIGCKRGTSAIVIEQAIQAVFQAHGLAEEAIAGIATVNTKADEVGLVAFCRDRHLPLRYFSADVLRSVTIPNPSSAIDKYVGTSSVAEAAALLACSLHAIPQLCVPKQIVRHVGQPGVVTVAVARSLATSVHPL
ncbi:MAG: cobalamin biosynthesis protein [Tildeniella nuda ZEHNDER 1965/U140]|jgi:cobalt-precorrin 5A hydrolase/precorrin-3B C17-methyltransferase|nr:cobalamin biosynthesis protein [Tildeniella nuda ZEHNDER 1965/U140]